ncbi:MAG: hypothetical protein Q6351_002970 [Candidatus Njordarchaeum guaymaensis]
MDDDYWIILINGKKVSVGFMSKDIRKILGKIKELKKILIDIEVSNASGYKLKTIPKRIRSPIPIQVKIPKEKLDNITLKEAVALVLFLSDPVPLSANEVAHILSLNLDREVSPKSVSSYLTSIRHLKNFVDFTGDRRSRKYTLNSKGKSYVREILART